MLSIHIIEYGHFNSRRPLLRKYESRTNFNSNHYYNHILERNRANQKKYYAKNREAIKIKNRIAYQTRYSKDPEFLAKRSKYFKKKYHGIS